MISFFYFFKGPSSRVQFQYPVYYLAIAVVVKMAPTENKTLAKEYRDRDKILYIKE